MITQAEDTEARLASVKRRLQADQDVHETVQKAITADKDEIARQGAALVEMGKQVL